MSVYSGNKPRFHGVMFQRGNSFGYAGADANNIPFKLLVETSNDTSDWSKANS